MLDREFDDVISKIPEYFYPAFAGELVSVFGISVLTPYKDGVNPLLYISGSGGWNMALEMACRKLNMDWMLDWYDKLEWYDSDDFDCELVELIKSKFLNGKLEFANSYYRWLLDKFEVS